MGRRQLRIRVQRRVKLVCKQPRGSPPIGQRKLPTRQHTFWTDLEPKIITIRRFWRMTQQKSILRNNRSVLIFYYLWTPPTLQFSVQKNNTVGLYFSNCIYFIVLFVLKIKNYQQLTVIELYIHFGKLTVSIPHPHI